MAWKAICGRVSAASLHGCRYTAAVACRPMVGLGYGCQGTRSGRREQRGPRSACPTRTGPARWRPKVAPGDEGGAGGANNHVHLDLPLGRIGGAGAWAPIRVFRAIDLAGKPVQERGRADDPQRPAGAGCCPIHARNRERPWFVLFDPVAALPKSAEFLEELHAEFGNLGLAAAAYNAGPQRVRDWIAGRGGLPVETRNYVIAITGRSVDEWAAGNRDHSDVTPTKHISCAELMAMFTEQWSPFVGELERRVSEGAARPWGVELSAGFVHDRVLAAYATVEKTYRAILENRDPIIIASKFRSRGTQRFYQVRVGADTRAGANQLCGALHNAGGTCLVLRNWVGKSHPL